MMEFRRVVKIVVKAVVVVQDRLWFFFSYFLFLQKVRIENIL